MGKETVKVARYRSFDYYVNYPTNTGGVKTYVWSGSKGKRVDVKEVPMELIDYLMVNSMCFKNGELKIIEDSPEAKEIIETIPEIEEYEANTHSKEEVEAILTGNFNKMKSELNKITNKDEKKFFIDVAKEIKLDSNSKLKFLAEWYGVKQDILFSEE
jgi:hypothetical protein